jgi:hypothetical protein
VDHHYCLVPAGCSSPIFSNTRTHALSSSHAQFHTQNTPPPPPPPPQVTVYPQQCAPWLLSPESVAILAPVLQGQHLEGAATPPAQLQQHLLEAVSHSLQVRKQSRLLFWEGAKLLQVCQGRKRQHCFLVALVFASFLLQAVSCCLVWKTIGWDEFKLRCN